MDSLPNPLFMYTKLGFLRKANKETTKCVKLTIRHWGQVNDHKSHHKHESAWRAILNVQVIVTKLLTVTERSRWASWRSWSQENPQVTKISADVCTIYKQTVYTWIDWFKWQCWHKYKIQCDDVTRFASRFNGKIIVVSLFEKKKRLKLTVFSPSHNS